MRLLKQMHRLFPRHVLPGLALAALCGGLTQSSACGIDDALVGAPCLEDGDCPNLSCVRTAAEIADSLSGLCSSDGACVPGEQAGCFANGEGLCPPSNLAAVADGDSTYCCPFTGGIEPMVLDIADDGTAECYGCDPCLNDNVEPCLAEEDRCEVDEGEPCGCRLIEDALLDGPCDDDDACGPFTCHRTLEQLEEPDEAQVSAQGIEQGQCRDDGTCVQGSQPGCRANGGSCAGDTVARNVGPLTFCCPEADNSGFAPAVYNVSPDEASAACTVCERLACDDVQGNKTEDECTALSDSTCIVPTGSLCGCAPPV